MRILGPKKPAGLTSDTAGFLIGLPEAEAESAKASRVQLAEVYEDFLGVEKEIAFGKFIVTGRKGSGKTAIAEHIENLANKDTNTKCIFIKGPELKLESLIASEGDYSGEALFEWLILSRLAKTIVEDKYLSERIDPKRHLSKFIQGNIRRVEIDGSTIQEIQETKSFNVNIQHLKRFVQANFKKDIGITRHQAPFYKIIPILRQVLVETLTEAKKSRDYEYIIIFDDLDIGVKVSNKKSIDALMDLLRISKYYNISLFGKTDIEFSILILLRNDIANILMTDYADSAKIFSSYSVNINWFEDLGSASAFGRSKLKQFINKRIALNFDRHGHKYDHSDPWKSFVDPSVGGEDDSFKHVAIRTYLVPRDLILLFKPITNNPINLPINTKDMNRLLLEYAQERYLETKNELSLWFDEIKKGRLIRIIEDIARYHNKPFIIYPEMINRIVDRLHVGETEAEEIIDILFDYSIFGNMDSQTGWVHFKYREPKGENYKINKEWDLVLHRSLEMAIKKRII